MQTCRIQLLLLAAIAAHLAACRHRTPLPPESVQVTDSQSLHFNAEAGLSMLRFTLPRNHPALQTIFESSPSTPAVIGPAQVESLRAEGFRVAAVPIDQLEALLASLPPDSSITTMTLGQAPDWREIAEGSRLNQPAVYLVSSRAVTLPSGRLRLIIRGYRLYSLDGPVLHLELVPQLHQPRPDPFRPDPIAENEQGRFFLSAALSLDLDGTMAIIVAGESPNADWTRIDQAAARPADISPGPIEAAPLLTLGQDILMDDIGNRHEVIVLFPTPDR